MKISKGMMMNDSKTPSSSLLRSFDFKPDPLAWSFVRQALISVSNINDFDKEVPKSNISDLESILEDVKLLTTFHKGDTTNDKPEHSNEGRSSDIKLSNDYTEDEIELLKIVSTCLVPESNYKMEIGLQEGPPLTEKGENISENDNSIAQNDHSLTVRRDNILHKGPLVSKDDNSIVPDVPLLPTDSNDILGKAPTVTENVYEITQDSCPIDENGNTNMAKELPVMENADQIMPNGCPIDGKGNTSMPKILLVMENADQIMLESFPIDDNGSTSMPKRLPVMENPDQIVPKGQQINNFCDACMPKVHPTTEHGDRNIPEHDLITENSNGIMQGPSVTGNDDRNLQVPPTENNNGGTLPRNFCLKCHSGGPLIMCEAENCFTSFHERCVVYLERSELGTFKCPLCFYKHTAMAYQVGKKRSLQAKKSLACFLVKDEIYNRIDKRRSAKANGDMNASGNNRKQRKKTEIQVQVVAMETEINQIGSKANSVQAQAITDNTVNLDEGKSNNAVSTINGTHEKGKATIIKSKDMPQEVLNMPVHKERAEIIPSGCGRISQFSNSVNQHTEINSKSKKSEKSSCNDKGAKRPNSEDTSRLRHCSSCDTSQVQVATASRPKRTIKVPTRFQD